MGFGDSTRINTNIQSLQAYASLQKTNSKLGMHQLRLATGSRINAAEDDSAGYSIAKKLEAKVRGQAQALSNIGDAKSMLTVAEGTLNTAMDILQTMKEKAVQAANDSMGAEERAAIHGQLSALQKELDDTLGTATFNGKDLFEADGTKFTFQVNAESGDTFDVDIGGMSTQGLGVEAAARSGKVFANGKLSAITVAAAGTYAADTKVDKSFEIEITGVDTSDVNPANHTITYKVDGGSETTDTIANLAAVAIDGDATNGLHVNFGANGLTAADYKVGQKITVKYDNLALNVTGNTNASTSLSTIDSAISSISKELANLGDAQNRLSFKQENLQTSMNNYEAARSRIIDADFAKEQMEIVKLQILQQTGTAALAQANAAPQAVLSLF